MSRPRSDDPLMPMPLRLPRSVVEQLRGRADDSGVSVSDVLRSMISAEQVKPLGKPRPRRRPPKSLGRVSAADPNLLRSLAKIGANMNQIARAVNAKAAVGKQIDVVQCLIVLRAMEIQLAALAADSGGPDAR